MAISVHDYEGSVFLPTPAGGTTANTLYFSSTNKQLLLPISTVTSSASGVTCYGPSDRKRLSGVKKKTGAAWVMCQPLTYKTSLGFFAVTTGAVIYGMALSVQVAGDTTGDVLLVSPSVSG